MTPLLALTTFQVAVRQDEMSEVKELYKVKCLTNMRWFYMNLYKFIHRQI